MKCKYMYNIYKNILHNVLGFQGRILGYNLYACSMHWEDIITVFIRTYIIWMGVYIFIYLIRKYSASADIPPNCILSFWKKPELQKVLKSPFKLVVELVDVCLFHCIEGVLKNDIYIII